MKKLLLFIVLGLISATAFSQQKYKIGLKVTPLLLAWNRLVVPRQASHEADGVKARLSAGVFFDYFFIGDNYAFSSGLTYTIKGGGIRFDSSLAYMVDVPIIEPTKHTRFVLQYIEIPVSVKLYTNEISTDMKLYFQVGVSGNILISAKVDNEKNFQIIEVKDSLTADTSTAKLMKNFFPIEASLVFSTGIELQMGENTYFFTGFTFNHGLTNIDKFYEEKHRVDGFVLKNSYFGIDVGLKF